MAVHARLYPPALAADAHLVEAVFVVVVFVGHVGVVVGDPQGIGGGWEVANFSDTSADYFPAAWHFLVVKVDAYVGYIVTAQSI